MIPILYANQLGRAYVRALGDVLGEAEATALLRAANLASLAHLPDDAERAFPAAQFAALNRTLESLYGARGGRGLALRVGRVWFTHGFQDLPLFVGMTRAPFRALALPQRAALSLQAFAHVLLTRANQPVSRAEHPTHWEVLLTPSPMAYGRQEGAPVCHSIVGVLQETLRWATDGHEYAVYETACSAAGAPSCGFRVQKQPLVIEQLNKRG
jgi:hypothetical protein